MYRSKSTDVWFNLPGVVAAYQPVACPAGALAARVNVSNEQRTPGRYAAVPGVAPAFDPRTGWTGDGATAYFATGITPSANWSMLVRFSNVVLSGARCAIGSSATGDTRFMIHATHASFGGNVLYGQGNYTTVAPGATAAVLGISGQRGYRDGAVEGSAIGAWSGTGNAIFLLARNSGSAAEYFNGTVQASAVYRRTLSPAEMWQASRQLAYCHVNPDWSAWGRRRRYYYAPSQAAFLAAWAARSNHLIGGGVNHV